jgi:hypothetical protein
MNKKTRALIGGVGVSAAVAAVALTGGTSAFYYKSDTTTDNWFKSCGFNLTSDADVKILKSDVTEGWRDKSQIKSRSHGSSVRIDRMQPGDKFELKFEITNGSKRDHKGKSSSTCDADAWWDINFPIQELRDGAWVGEPQEGELDFTKALTVDVKGFDNDFTTFDQLMYAPPQKLGKLKPGQTAEVKVNVHWPLGNREDGNDLMNHGVKFTLDYALSQVGTNPVSPDSGLTR